MSDDATALEWVLRQAIEIRNERRRGLPPNHAQDEHADLFRLCALLDKMGASREAGALTVLLGPA